MAAMAAPCQKPRCTRTTLPACLASGRALRRNIGAMNTNTPKRVEHQHTDKGYVPVYTTAVVEQPWASYSATDHEVWATLFKRQREILVGRASDEFLRAQDAMGMTPGRDPEVRRPQPRAARGHRLGADRRRGPAAGTDVLRPPRQPPLPGDLVDPQARAARLPGRARPVPRPVRPRAAADEPGVRRLHAGLRPRRGQGARRSARRRWSTSRACTGTRSSSA